MFAFDSRPTLDPTQVLGREIVAALRTALVDQRTAGSEPTIAVQRAIIAAAGEARLRQLAPETLLIQLKALADEVGIRPIEHAHTDGVVSVREWMVGALLRAYWQPPSE